MKTNAAALLKTAFPTPKALHNTAQGCSVEHRVFTPKALHNTAQGRASAPWEKNATGSSTPKGLHRPIPPLVQPLRGRASEVSSCSPILYPRRVYGISWEDDTDVCSCFHAVH